MGQPMATIYSTSEAGYELIKRFEGCEKRLPDNRLQAYKVGADPWTIGWGQTGKMPDGRKVEEGLIITQEEADTALQYFVRAVVDPLVRKHFVCRSQAEHDACASWVYNVRHDRLERGDYSLPSLVNLKARDMEAIVNRWLQYVATPGFENGLYRRRIAEVLMFMGLPWNVPAVWGYISTAVYTKGGVKQPTDPWFIIEIAESAKPIPSEPDPPKAPEPVKPVEVKPLPEVSPVDPELPPKKIEESKTGKAVNRASRGRETIGIGGLGVIFVTIAQQIEAVGKSLDAIGMETMLKVGLFAFIGLAGLGVWMWWSGRNEAYMRRQQVQDPKY